MGIHALGPGFMTTKTVVKWEIALELQYIVGFELRFEKNWLGNGIRTPFPDPH